MKVDNQKVRWYIERAIPDAGYHASNLGGLHGYAYMECCRTFLFRFLVFCLEFESGKKGKSHCESIESELVSKYSEMLSSIFNVSVWSPICHVLDGYCDYEHNVPKELISLASLKLNNVLELEALLSRHEQHQRFIKGLVEAVLLNMANKEVATQVMNRIQPLCSDSQHVSDADNVIAWFEEDFIVDNFELIDSSSGTLANWFKTYFEEDIDWKWTKS